MNNEIHIYIGSGRIEEKSNYNYPAGERHPFLLYLKSHNDLEYNPLEAENTIVKLGLTEIEFTKVGKLSTEKINDDEKKRVL